MHNPRDMNSNMRKKSSIDAIRKRKRMDIFALRRKITDSQYVISADKQYPYRIIRRGLDVTPKIYEMPGVHYGTEEDMISWTKKMTKKVKRLYPSEEESDKESYILGSDDFMNIVSNVEPVQRFDVWYSKKELKMWEREMKGDLYRAPSMFRLREDPPRLPAIPQEIYTTRLQETSTLYLCDINTRLVKEGSQQEQEHKKMAELQKKKKELFSLKLLVPYRTAFSQTFEKSLVVNWCQLGAPERKNASVDVYINDRIKTFLELGIYNFSNPRRSRIESFFEARRRTLVVSSDEEDTKSMYGLQESKDNNKEETKEKQSWLESLDFFKGTTLMERMLSSNLNMQLQLLYHERLYTSDPSVESKYLPQLLWVVSCPKVFGKAVTSITWSSEIPELFAVSYGKYLFNTKTNGVVCIWNIKNTEYPERMSIFEEPVTYVEFSRRSPRIMSVAFWNGSVALLDGILKEPEIMVQSTPELGSLLPVYQFKWFQMDDIEALVSCGENGEIHVFKQNLKFKNKMIMKLRVLGNTVNVGVEGSQKTAINDCSPIGPAATTICQHPRTNYIYLVGSDTGLVYICSIFRRRHIGVFAAHSSAVTSIQFNPVEDRLLLTSGCDFHIRIWLYGHFESYLLQFKYRLAYVDYAVWNPVHPYIIIAAVKHYIEVWHIKENPHVPITVIENPYKNRNLVISFNPTGANFLVGDMKGYVFIYGISSIPTPPKDPLKKLAEAILFALEFDEDRLKLLERTLGGLFTKRKHNDL